MGRRREDTAAASNVIQSLALLSLAVVLKFDGYHLALALAGESLALALAFHRFRKTPEFLFSVLCGIGAVFFEGIARLQGGAGAPVWSGVLGAVVVALAAGIMRFNVGRTVKPSPPEVRLAAAVLCYAAMAILMCGGCLRLGAGGEQDGGGGQAAEQLEGRRHAAIIARPAAWVAACAPSG